MTDAPLTAALTFVHVADGLYTFTTLVVYLRAAS